MNVHIYISDDSPDMKNKDMAETTQTKYIEALQYFINSHAIKSEYRHSRLGQVLFLLTEVRCMSHLHEKHREELFNKVKGMEVPPLLLEFLTS